MKVVKKREVPIRIPILEFVLNRISDQHPAYRKMKSDHINNKSGFKGENELDYFINLNPSKDLFNLQDIRLKISGRFFQIDSLIISATFILIIEVKNWGGRLIYDSKNKKVLQTYGNGEYKKFKDPELQVNRHKVQLESWLKKYHFKCPPILTLVVMSNPEVVIDFDEKNESTEKIVTPDHALEKLEKIQLSHQTQVLNRRDINNITKLISEKHTPKEFNVFKEYGITNNDLLPGVQCPKCNKIPMTKKYKTWFCPACHIHSAKAHEQLIKDFLLINSSISNKQCREILGLPPSSTRIVSRYLNKMNLPSSGSTSNRIYYSVTNPISTTTYSKYNKSQDSQPKGKGLLSNGKTYKLNGKRYESKGKR
jgi:hypothetical protein